MTQMARTAQPPDRDLASVAALVGDPARAAMLTALAEARTCYDHLAGRRGVELRDRLLAAGALHVLDDRDHALTATGERLVTALGIDLDRVRAARRVFARSCLDWTQRRPHLAGALPAALTGRFLALGWLGRRGDRGLRVAAHYDQSLDRWLAPPGMPEPTS